MKKITFIILCMAFLVAGCKEDVAANTPEAPPLNLASQAPALNPQPAATSPAPALVPQTAAQVQPQVQPNITVLNQPSANSDALAQALQQFIESNNQRNERERIAAEQERRQDEEFHKATQSWGDKILHFFLVLGGVTGGAGIAFLLSRWYSNHMDNNKPKFNKDEFDKGVRDPAPTEGRGLTTLAVGTELLSRRLFIAIMAAGAGIGIGLGLS